MLLTCHAACWYMYLESLPRRRLVIKRAWPSCMRTLSGDHERFENVYFNVYKGYYFTGDGCRRDSDGYYWLTGACQHENIPVTITSC